MSSSSANRALLASAFLCLVVTLGVYRLHVWGQRNGCKQTRTRESRQEFLNSLNVEDIDANCVKKVWCKIRDSDSYYREIEHYDNEVAMYERIGQHNRVAEFIGVNTAAPALVLRFYPYGQLRSRLLEMAANSYTPEVDTRIVWGTQIASAIAYLHSIQVSWSDAHFGNVLVTDDHNLVICDFMFSVYRPNSTDLQTTRPPPPFVSRDHRVYTADTFGFATMLYALLELRFPFCASLNPTPEEQHAVEVAHWEERFDRLTDSVLDSVFDDILFSCWNGDIEFGADIGAMMDSGAESWLAMGRHAETSNWLNREASP